MTDRQRAFADYYIECGNATEAARRAGYSKKCAQQIGAENLLKPVILEYIKNRTAKDEEKRIASGDDALRFFTMVMDGKAEGATMTDRIAAGREILKRYVTDRKLEIEFLKLESQIKDNQPEEDTEDNFLDALNASAAEVWKECEGEDNEM